MYHVLYNCVFCLAFINFLNYWIYLFFSEEKNTNETLSHALSKPAHYKMNFSNVSYNEAVPWNLFEAKQWDKNQTKYLCFFINSSLWFVLTLLIFFRIIECHHFPLANFYEALVFLTWCLVTLNVIILFEPTNASLFQFSVHKQISGAILAPCILFIIAFAQFNLEETITPLVPALKSNWLLMHVSIMICSYTTFMVGGLLAFFLLIQSFYGYLQKIVKISNLVSLKLHISRTLCIFNFMNPFSRSKIKHYALFSDYDSSYDFSINQTIVANNPTFAHSSFPSFNHILEGPIKMQKKNLYIVLDNLSYRMMGIGFPLFTLGILSGALWANEAWGSYWSWDIKEVGSFINWLFVALYFHCRYKNYIMLSHTVAFISLMVLFFNFFGISLGIFGNSLHAYGAAS